MCWVSAWAHKVWASAVPTASPQHLLELGPESSRMLESNEPSGAKGPILQAQFRQHAWKLALYRCFKKTTASWKLTKTTSWKLTMTHNTAKRQMGFWSLAGDLEHSSLHSEKPGSFFPFKISGLQLRCLDSLRAFSANVYVWILYSQAELSSVWDFVGCPAVQLNQAPASLHPQTWCCWERDALFK